VMRKGYRREAGSEGSAKQRCEPMNKNRYMPANNAIAEQPYTVFVRIWNLGLLAAIGATVSVYSQYLNITQNQIRLYSPPELVGQEFFDLQDCYSPDCRTVIKLRDPWVPSVRNFGAWLIARVTCFADVAPDTFAVQGEGRPDSEVTDRHVGARFF
jgi:hypothetical protein